MGSVRPAPFIFLVHVRDNFRNVHGHFETIYYGDLDLPRTATRLSCRDHTIRPLPRPIIRSRVPGSVHFQFPGRIGFVDLK